MESTDVAQSDSSDGLGRALGASLLGLARQSSHGPSQCGSDNPDGNGFCRCFRRHQTSRSTSAVTKVLSAALCIIGAGILAAPAIRGVYDIEVGPDPRRFGLAANIGMDSAVVAVLLALMGAIEWNLRRFGLKSR